LQCGKNSISHFLLNGRTFNRFHWRWLINAFEFGLHFHPPNLRQAGIRSNATQTFTHGRGFATSGLSHLHQSSRQWILDFSYSHLLKNIGSPLLINPNGRPPWHTHPKSDFAPLRDSFLAKDAEDGGGCEFAS